MAKTGASKTILIAVITVFVVSLGTLVYLLRPTPKPTVVAQGGGEGEKKAPDAPAKKPPRGRIADPTVQGGGGGGAATGDEDPNGFARPCPQVLNDALDDFMDSYLKEVESDTDRNAAAAVRYYTRCRREANEAALKALPEAQRKQLELVRGILVAVPEAVRKLPPKPAPPPQPRQTAKGLVMPGPDDVIKSTDPKPRALAERGDITREDLLNDLIVSLDPEQAKVPLPKAVIESIDRDGEALLKGLRQNADRLAKEKDRTVAAEAQTVRRAADDVALLLKRLPPMAAKNLLNYLSLFAQ